MKKMTKEKLVLFGIIGAALISLLGVVISSATQTKIEWIPATQTAQSFSMTEKANSIPPRLIISDTFDNNHNDWDLGSDVLIQNGVLQRYLETDSGGWSTTEIPGVVEKNYCLILDVRLKEISETAEVVIVLRAINYSEYEKRSYIRIRLSDNGKGGIWVKLNGNEEQRVSEFESAVLGDEQSHKFQISIQDNVIEISELNSGRTPQRVVIDNDKLILDSGVTRLGLEIPVPNQKAIVEFDNLFLYNKCP